MIKKINTNKMKLNKWLVIVVVIIALLTLLILSYSIFKKPRSTELGNLTFEEFCKSNNDMWMEMEPTRNGEKLSDEMCFGCMIADSHFCSADEYTSYIESLPSFIR